MNIFCPNCENECSEAAPTCPRCGHPLMSPLQELAAAAKGLNSVSPDRTCVHPTRGRRIATLALLVGAGAAVAISAITLFLVGTGRMQPVQNLGATIPTESPVVENVRSVADEPPGVSEAAAPERSAIQKSKPDSVTSLAEAMATASTSLVPLDTAERRHANAAKAYRRILGAGIRVVSGVRGELRETSVAFAELLPEHYRTQWLRESMELVVAPHFRDKFREMLSSRGLPDAHLHEIAWWNHSLEAVFNLATDGVLRTEALAAWNAQQAILYSQEWRRHEEWERKRRQNPSRYTGGQTPVLRTMPLWKTQDLRSHGQQGS